MVPGELKDHLFLLNRVESGLPDVVRGLSKPLVDSGAKGAETLAIRRLSRSIASTLAVSGGLVRLAISAVNPVRF